MGWYGWRDVQTQGVLVAGRPYDFSDFNRAQVIALSAAIDAVAERHDIPLVAVPADIDLTDETSTDDTPAYCSALVGVLVAAGGTDEPLPVTREAMREGLAQAQRIPDAVWAEITAAYREAGGKQASDDAIALRLGCTGASPMAKLAFGRLGPEGAGLGGTFVHGQGPDQRAHETGVHGIQIAVCSYDGSSADPIDVSNEADAARRREVPDGAYYLIAHYD